MSAAEGTRLNKFLSEIGFCSRREADKLLEGRKVKLNGQIAGIGAKVFPGDKVMVNGQFIDNDAEEHVYIAFNKPVGIVCTTDTLNERNNIVDFIRHERRIFPIGRLDKDSEGLIFLTSDGDIVNKILRAGNKHEKEYIVTVDRPISKEFVAKMASGIPILGGTTKKCIVEQTKADEFRIVLTQGLNRQIRRMCEFLEYNVLKLKRVRIMNIKLDVGQGNWRNLNPTEMLQIQSMLAGSSNTSPKAAKGQGISNVNTPKSKANNSELSKSSSKKPTAKKASGSANSKIASHSNSRPISSARNKSKSTSSSSSDRSKSRSKPTTNSGKGRNRSGKR
jgi:23S rRNA pseudouridine2604 synthase